MYSCDANDDAEEGEIRRGKINVNIKKDRSCLGLDDSLERANTEEGI